MRLAFDQFSWDQAGALFRRRTTALLLVLVAHVLLVILLLRLTPPTPPSGPVVTPFELLPDRQEHARKAPEPKRAEKKSARQPAAPPPPPAAELPYKLGIIEITREEFAAADIARLPSPDRAASAGPADASADAEPAATGPNGERLYNAEWYREPTQAELSYYLPGGGARTGWAMIACQTVADYRVDNCIELGQSPAGSGLAAAIRQAAWQFRVLPPRIGGRPLVGAWVSIRIDFTQIPAK